VCGGQFHERAEEWRQGAAGAGDDVLGCIVPRADGGAEDQAEAVRFGQGPVAVGAGESAKPGGRGASSAERGINWWRWFSWP
jgi:hypothetical protein